MVIQIITSKDSPSRYMSDLTLYSRKGEGEGPVRAVLTEAGIGTEEVDELLAEGPQSDDVWLDFLSAKLSSLEPKESNHIKIVRDIESGDTVWFGDEASKLLQEGQSLS